MADVVVPRTEKFVEEGDLRGRLETPPRKLPWTTRELDHVTITRVWWHSVGPLFSRRIVERVGPFQSDVPPYAEELDFHGRVKLTTRRVAYVDEVLNFDRKGSPSALTGAPSKVYSGRIQSAHVACELLRGFQVRDRHEWSSLFAMCFRTYYQTVCCTNARELQDQAWQSLREIAGQCSAPLKMTRLIPRPLLDVAFRGAHRLRQSVGAH